MVVKRTELTAMQETLLELKDRMDKLRDDLRIVSKDADNLPELEEYIPALMSDEQWAREVMVRAFIIGATLRAKSKELKMCANQAKILMQVCTPEDITIFEEAINGSLELV